MIDIIARGKKDIWIKQAKSDTLLQKKKLLTNYILKVFRKHVPIIQETKTIPFSGTNFGKQAKVIIPNFCDIYKSFYLQLNIQPFIMNQNIDLRYFKPSNQNHNFGFTQYLIFACIENIQLYAGKQKIDQYTGLQLYHKMIEDNNIIQRNNILRKSGYYIQTSPDDHTKVYQNQGGNLFLKIPFDILQEYRTLPTLFVQGSPLEIRIKFRKLERLIYPKQNLSSIVNTDIEYVNVNNEKVVTKIQKPKLKFAYLHMEGLHIAENIRNEFSKFNNDLTCSFTTYDTQEYTFLDHNKDNYRDCIHTMYRIPNNNSIANFTLPLEYQNPVQTFTLYPSLDYYKDENQYFVNKFDINKDNSDIITRIGLQVHSHIIYPELRSKYYTQVTSYTTRGQNLLYDSFYLPLNIFNQDRRFNYGYVDYSKVNNSFIKLTLTGWESIKNRTSTLSIIGKIYKLLHMKNGVLKLDTTI